MSKKRAGTPLIVPIFIPNQGCPHRCVFCQQERITACSHELVSTRRIRDIVETAMHSSGFRTRRPREIAFFGGTFSGLPVSEIIRLLDAVRPYLERGEFDSIRVSTRPDTLDEERLEILSRFGVSTIELGAQSMDDEVLEKSRRGHSAEDTVRAVGLLKERGFKVGLQLMPGLPGDSEARFRDTIEKVLKLTPHMVRLYPAIVIRGTRMAQMFREGTYRPLNLEDAVRLCADSCIRLESQGIPVIRIGLMSSSSLRAEGQILAGPWHEAFGHLVRTMIHQKNIGPLLPEYGIAEKIRLRVPAREISLVRGHRNQGLHWIKKRTGAGAVEVIPYGIHEPGRIKVEILEFKEGRFKS
ncbi:MAG: radical SAM protein [Deltaproteobacteria bacterium]|nr:radical SAM protein [Deltaproteobacteria bacterium]MBW2016184.1 radical SAM protein [Deltaproteobacteria bacterium]MBW2130333.1 radical SAM protein [Deltaproteobacteria bacterium]MBW2302699.1 radical SAM protein [Deltaproteobacteria bacterium]